MRSDDHTGRHMQVPAVPLSGSAHMPFLLQSSLDAQLVLHAPAVASQAYGAHDV
jgi:hypothetical protein